MRTCPSCANYLVQGQTICDKCGLEVHKDVSATKTSKPISQNSVAKPTQNTITRPIESTEVPDKHNNIRIFGIIAGCIGFIVLMTVTFLMIFGFI